MLTDFAQAGDWLSTLSHTKFYNFKMLLAELASIYFHSFLTRKRKPTSEHEEKKTFSLV